MAESNIFTRLLDRVRGRPRAQAIERRDQPWLFWQWLAHDQPAGVTITMDSALELSVVWACVRVISDALASAWWSIFDIGADGRRNVLPPTDALSYVLNLRPNPDMTPMAAREVLIFSALTWGNGYAEIVRTASGKVVELWPLLPHKVQPRRDPLTGRLFYLYSQQDGGQVRLEDMEVFHLRGPGISGLMGDNLVARAAKSMALAAAQERFASTYYGNNTAIGGVLETPRVLSDQAYKRLNDDWEDKHKGPNRAHKVAILEEGVQFKAVANNAQEAQAIESRSFSVTDICRWFGVPPHKVQHLDRATFSNIEHLAIEFVRDALTPWARRLEQEADYKLLGWSYGRRRTLLDLAPLTQGDFKTRAEGYAIMANVGAFSINDILHQEGRNGIGPDGDVRMVGVNMQTLQRLLNPPEPKPAPAAGPAPEPAPDEGES